MKRKSFYTAVCTSLLGLLLSICSFGQVVDNFNDGDFTTNPTWTGSSTFIVNATQELQLNDVAPGQSHLTTSFSSINLANKEWTFTIRQTFSGSDSNQSRFYLSASGGSPWVYTGAGSAGVTGYFLKFGETGSADAIKFCRDNGTGTVIELAAGVPSLIANSFTLRVKVTCDAEGLFTCWADPSGGTNFTQQFTVNDTTYPTSSALGLICSYTTSNADNFFFDNIYFGDIIVDNEAPSLVSVTPTSSTTLHVLFSEAVASANASNIANYSIDSGIGNPTSAVVNSTNPSLVELTFTTPFPENADLNLTVTNISDLSNNLLTSATLPFLFFVPATAFPRDVLFSEVLADPTPQVGLPNAEYVEIVNRSASAFDLAEWQLVNTTTTMVLPAYTLAPNQHAVICDDLNAALFNNPIVVASFSALTNGGDSLTLLSNSGTVLDILVYSIDWYATSSKAEGGWSLELINPELACQSASNWAESVSPTGGTPALPNSVLNTSPDTELPVIAFYEVAGAQQIVITFSETMASVSLDDISLTIAPALTVLSTGWNGNFDQLIITTQESIAFGITYSLSLGGLFDCSGNLLGDTTLTLTQGFSPEENELLITEIMADPDPSIGSPDAEYIEIHNKGNRLLDLKNCQLNSAVFATQTLLAPGAYLMIGDQSDEFSFVNVANKKLIESFPGLTNTQATLTLSDPNGNPLDQVSYTDEWYGDPAKQEGGFSLELINPFAPCSGANNWKASTAVIGGTPGEQNSVYDLTPDTTPPLYTYPIVTNLGVMNLFFNETLGQSTIQFTIDGIEIYSGPASFASANLDGINLSYGALDVSQLHTFTLSGVIDCSGNAAPTIEGTFGIPQPVEEGDLLINEILYNAYTGADDYIELYNRSVKTISLRELQFARETEGIVEDYTSVSDDNRILMPGEYLVFTEKKSHIIGRYPFAREQNIFIVDNLPTYNDDEGVVVLADLNNLILDRVPYTDEQQYPLLDDLNGASLERIDYNRPSDEATNWHTAAESQGFGTPGYVNSQAMDAGITEDQLTIFPEVFSPDLDGFQDVTTFSYRLNEEGYTGNITLYDSEGRRVNRIMRNELLGKTGSISWDGFNEENQKMPIGIYVVYVEFFATDGRVSKFKRTCVLAHPLD